MHGGAGVRAARVRLGAPRVLRRVPLLQEGPHEEAPYSCEPGAGAAVGGRHRPPCQRCQQAGSDELAQSIGRQDRGLATGNGFGTSVRRVPTSA